MFWRQKSIISSSTILPDLATIGFNTGLIWYLDWSLGYGSMHPSVSEPVDGQYLDAFATDIKIISCHQPQFRKNLSEHQRYRSVPGVLSADT